MLSRVARGPPDFQIQNTRGFPQPNMLFQRRSAEGPSTANGSVNRPTSTSVFDADVDARPNGRAIAFHSNQLQINPVVPVARVFKEPKGVRITRNCATDLGK